MEGTVSSTRPGAGSFDGPGLGGAQRPHTGRVVDLRRITDPARLDAVRQTGLLDTPAEAVFNDLAELAARLLGMPLAFVTLVDDQRSYWKATVGTGIADTDTRSRQNTVQESFCQYLVATDGPVVIADASVDDLTRDNPSVESMGVRAWAGYPVRHPAGHVLGSFCVVDTSPRTFTDDDLTTLSMLATAASREVALRLALTQVREAGDELQRRAELLTLEQYARARQQAQVDQNLATLQGLNRAAIAMNALDTVEAVLRACTEQAATLIGARQAVSSVTRGPDWSQAVTAVVLDGEYAAWRDYAALPDGSGIYALVCETNQPIRLTQDELEAHPRWRGFGSHAADHPPMRGWLAAPLVARDGSNLGLIQLSDKTSEPADHRAGRGPHPPAEFSDENLAVLVQLAQIAGPALEKAVSFEREHQIAVELQRSLLPILPSLPGVAAAARYLPGTDDMLVGGDWYDLFELRPGWVALAVGDVVGHGLRSASLMGQLRSALRAYAMVEDDPAAVVAHLDRLAATLHSGYDEQDLDVIATLAYAAWHPASGIVRLILAGHPAPLTRDRDGRVSTMDADPGLPLGAVPGLGYTETIHRLEPGAALLLFSDGLVESRTRPVGDGLAELRATLAEAPVPLDDLDALSDHLIAELTGGRNDDDLAVLIVSHPS